MYDNLTARKMIFIYNALLNGWSVKMVGRDKFVFKRPVGEISREINLGDYLQKFVEYNVRLDNF